MRTHAEDGSTPSNEVSASTTETPGDTANNTGVTAHESERTPFETQSYNLTELTQEDKAAVDQLHRSRFGSPFNFERSFLQKLIIARMIIIRDRDNSIVGMGFLRSFTGYTFAPLLREKSTFTASRMVTIESVAVAADHEGKHFASAIINQCFQDLNKAGLATSKTETQLETIEGATDNSNPTGYIVTVEAENPFKIGKPFAKRAQEHSFQRTTTSRELFSYPWISYGVDEASGVLYYRKGKPVELALTLAESEEPILAMEIESYIIEIVGDQEEKARLGAEFLSTMQNLLSAGAMSDGPAGVAHPYTPVFDESLASTIDTAQTAFIEKISNDPGVVVISSENILPVQTAAATADEGTVSDPSTRALSYQEFQTTVAVTNTLAHTPGTKLLTQLSDKSKLRPDTIQPTTYVICKPVLRSWRMSVEQG